MAVPREITDDMANQFRKQIRASTDITEAEIRSGLAAVFVDHVWAHLDTEQDEDGWDQEVFTGELISDDPFPPHVLDTWWRAVELSQRFLGAGQEAEIIAQEARDVWLPILLSPPEGTTHG